MDARRYFVCLLVAVFLGIAGCTLHTDPLSDWNPLGTFTTALVPEVIKKDAQAFFHALPTDEKGAAEWDTSVLSYWKDGDGQHAVVLEYQRAGEIWRRALIYNRDNRCIKALKYSVGSYSS